MPHSLLRKPLLPRHYSLWFDPPDEAGDETLHIVSERRAIKLKGQAFREFNKSAVPLLDGHHTLEEIQAAVAAVFRPQDLLECLELLQRHGIVVEGDLAPLPAGAAARMSPQINLFHDLAPGQDIQARLSAATVTVLGLGGAGGALALTLAAAGVGSIRCADWLPVTATDVYFAPFLGTESEGTNRAEAVARQIRDAAPGVMVSAHKAALTTEAELRELIGGAHYVVCCLDPSQANLVYKLNRVCLADAVPWITCAPAGAEVTVGPAFQPPAGACYMCYRMRLIACAGNPEDAFAYERILDRRQRDDSAARESLVFSVGLAAQFLGLEVVKSLTQLAEPSLIGRLLTIRLTDLAIERHTVLQKPWCPACGGPPSGAGDGQ